MAKLNPFQLVQQTRSEVGKIAWPNRREVMLTTVMVFVLATITAIFFFGVDAGINLGLRTILSLAG